MASPDDISVNSRVSIDNKGFGTVKDLVFRGFGTLYLVKLDDIDFEVELPRERLQIADKDLISDQPTTKQTTQTAVSNSRFSAGIVSASMIDEYNERLTNRKTLIKTNSDLKILGEFLALPEINETRSIDEIPPVELCPLLCRFILSVKKQNGEDYEPSSFRGMISSFDRQLRRKNYPQTINSGPAFAKVMDTLKMKQRELKMAGRGNLPNKADPINTNDIEVLWQSGQLGHASPDCILQTLWLYTTIHFGLRGCQEHRDMTWGDVTLKKDDSGQEYLEFCERQTKTRTGENPRDIRKVTPKLWSNTLQPERCPIKVYKIYAEKRPTGYSQPDDPFYIASTTVHNPSSREPWFKRNPVGVNKLGTFMKRMVGHAGLVSQKRLTNHSARKHLVQKLSDKNVPANHIMQMSGHKNIHSINNYSSINTDQHRAISEILYSNDKTPSSVYPSSSAQAQYSVNTQMTHSAQSASKSSVHVSGGLHSIFGSHIYGGTINVTVHQVFPQENSENTPPRKRIRRISSDTDSD